MTAGYLSGYFRGVASKLLSAVEANPASSNQHEFNGDEGLRRLLGEANRKLEAAFIYLDDSDNLITADGWLTWYDARANHPTRTEYRLYFPSTAVSARAAEGDLLLVALRNDGGALVLIAQAGSTIANQIRWLFGIGPDAAPGFAVREKMETERDRINFISRFILDQIGVPVEPDDQAFLESILDRFGPVFPPAREFSTFAREAAPGTDPIGDPDASLMTWMDREEVLFRTLEKHILTDRLAKGFHGDVDAFLALSLSVQNRRKSRAGLALENHFQHLLDIAHVRYDRTPFTEGRSRPDFLFPSAGEYRDPDFSPAFLTMLGVKSTCKERWRQVLAEADRIPQKHLLTLEAAISQNQTSEMARANLQLVIPAALQQTFSPAQRPDLLSVGQFIELVRARQAAAGKT